MCIRDSFWGHGLQKWDRMAGLFIAQSAGCLIGDFSGKPDTYDSDHMIVSSPKCFKDLNKCVAMDISLKSKTLLAHS